MIYIDIYMYIHLYMYIYIHLYMCIYIALEVYNGTTGMAALQGGEDP